MEAVLIDELKKEALVDNINELLWLLSINVLFKDSCKGLNAYKFVIEAVCIETLTSKALLEC